MNSLKRLPNLRFSGNRRPTLVALLVSSFSWLAGIQPAAAKDSFINTDWQTVASTTNSFGHAMRLTYQGPPPSSDSGTYDGSPCNWSSTGRTDTIAPSQWSGTGISVFLWANRRNYVGSPNNGANPIAPTLRRSQPLPWQSGTYYVVGSFVFVNYDAGSDWWICQTAHTSGGSFSPSNWSEVATSDITSGLVLPPECRFEYSTFANALAANLVQVRWLAGNPDHTDTGTGYLDAMSASGATLSNTYTHTYIDTNPDTLSETGLPPAPVTLTSPPRVRMEA